MTALIGDPDTRQAALGAQRGLTVPTHVRPVALHDLHWAFARESRPGSHELLGRGDIHLHLRINRALMKHAPSFAAARIGALTPAAPTHFRRRTSSSEHRTT